MYSKGRCDSKHVGQ